MKEKVTIYTLAKELQVSPSAVCRAFNPQSKISDGTRQLILETAKKRGYTPNKMASRLSRDTIHIGVVMHGHMEIYYAKMLDGIRDAYSALQSYKVSCNIVEMSKENFSIEKACTVLEEFKNEHYDGVIVHGLYHPDMIDKMNELARLGISVVTLHNDIPACSRLFTSTINTAVTADMVCQLFDILLSKENRNIVAFTGSMQSLIHQNLMRSFASCAGKYGLNFLKHFDTMDIPETAEKLIHEVMTSGQKIDGIYVSSSNSAAICRYLEANRLTHIKVVASDVFDELSRYLKSGTVSATIFQDPYAQGYAAFEKLYHYLADNIAVPDVVTTTPQIVMTSNLTLYL